MIHAIGIIYILGDPSAKRANKNTSAQKRCARAVLETLELRTLLSTVNIPVTNLADSGAGSLRSAVAAANNDAAGNDIIINLASLAGVITLTSGDLLLTGAQLLLTGRSGTTTFTGPGASLLSISGNNAGRVFGLNAGVTATFSGLTITGGQFPTGAGGGIYSADGTLALTNCVVSGNSADYGGGIFCPDGTLTLTNCTVSGNTALNDRGGGILLGSGGHLASATIINSTISDNTAGNYGGGIYSGGEGLTLFNCTLAGNTAGTNSGPTITHAGGAIYGANSTLALTNCTVAYNSADVGGGIVSSGTMTLNNTIVAGNNTPPGGTTPSDINEPDVGSLILTGSHNLIGTGGAGGLTDGTNGNIVGVTLANLKLGLLQNNGGPTPTIALLPGSPALDAGNNTLARDASDQTLTTDQRGSGYARIINSTVDIGAFEFSFSEITVLFNSISLANNATANLGSAAHNSVTSPITFTIRNDGTAPLTVSDFAVSAGFTLVQTPSSPIAPGASATLQVKLDSSTLGSKTGTLQFFTNDADGGDGIENPFVLHLTGTITPPSPAELFIRQIYRDVLQREVDAGGLSYWLSFYNAGHTYPNIATAITSSREYDGIVVDAFYAQYLGRHSELAGLNIWVDQMQAGLNAEVIRAGILGSDEFFILQGGTAIAYVTVLYQDFLHRDPDAAGLSVWTGQFDYSSPTNTTQSRIRISTSISHSNESRTAIVTGFYQTFLHRNPDDAGLQVWITNLANDISQPQIISFFVTTQEYLNLHNIS